MLFVQSIPVTLQQDRMASAHGVCFVPWQNLRKFVSPSAICTVQHAVPPSWSICETNKTRTVNYLLIFVCLSQRGTCDSMSCRVKWLAQWIGQKILTCILTVRQSSTNSGWASFNEPAGVGFSHQGQTWTSGVESMSAILRCLPLHRWCQKMRGNSLTSLIQKTLQEKLLPNTRPPFDAQLFSTGGQVGVKNMRSHDIQDMILVTVSKKADEDVIPSDYVLQW